MLIKKGVFKQLFYVIYNVLFFNELKVKCKKYSDLRWVLLECAPLNDESIRGFLVP